MTLDYNSDQRMEALHKANETRAQRAKLKGDLKSGRTAVGDVLARPPEFAVSMKVIDLLGALRGYGRVKVGKVLSQCDVAASKSLGSLTQRQRRELTHELRRARRATSDPYVTVMSAQSFDASTGVDQRPI
jgi:Spy/CpxP family protein refolding chaperone